MKTRLNHARANVKDIKKAVKWYEEVLGFVCNDVIDEDTYYVDFVREEGATFALLKCENVPAYGRYNFDVNNVDELWLKLKDKVNVIQPIETMPYGTRKFTIADIDGNELGFVQQNWQNENPKNDWLFIKDNSVYSVRTAGVLIKNNMLLVQREKDGNEYALPGGHLKHGETLENGLIREYKEETGADIKCKRLLWTEECFWDCDDKKVHTLAFYYLIELCNEYAMLNNEELLSQKDNCNVLLEWVPIERLESITIYPQFIKEKIYEMKDYCEHFISR